jgi:hypothetical protein
MNLTTGIATQAIHKVCPIALSFLRAILDSII